MSNRRDKPDATRRSTRRKPTLPRRGVPKTISASSGGTIEIVNVRVRVGEEDERLDWVRRARSEAKTDDDKDADDNGETSYGVDGLGIVPGLSSQRGSGERDGGDGAEVLHMTETTADSVQALLARRRDIDGVDERMPTEEKSEVDLARERLMRANLSAPIVEGEAVGLSRAVPARRMTAAAATAAVLDEISAQERHSNRVASKAAQALSVREEAERTSRAKRLREDRLRRRVLEKGFDEEWTERAIAANPEIGETNKEALERLGSVLDWLCLRVPKDDMPDTFVRLSEASKKQEESKTSLVVKGANAVNAALVSDAPAEDPYVLLLQRAMLGRLMAMGFSKAEARETLESSGWVEEDATFALLKSLQPEGVSRPENAEASEAEAERGEESMALEAILDENFKIESDGKMWRVRVELEEDANGVQWEPCELEVHFPPSNVYPAEAALFVIRHEKLPAQVRRSVMAAVASQAQAYIGEPSVYAMVVWLQENMPTILAERGIADDEEQPVQPNEEEEEEFVLTGRGAHIRRTYERLEAAQAEKHAQEVERQERIEYFRRMMVEEHSRAESEELIKERSRTTSECDASDAPIDAGDSSLEAKLSRWEREHEKRLEAIKARAAKPKKKVVPNVGKAKNLTSASDAKPSKGKGGWLANQVKKAGLDQQPMIDATDHEDVLATASANVLAGMSNIRPEKHTAEQRARISKNLLDAELAKAQSSEWRKMQENRAKLPAHDLKDTVLQAIENSSAAVVSGATGCGKTTQVPQFIFEEAIKAGKGGETSVIITQPRRLSAIAVAERVANERCERIGDTVGYSIRLESRQSEKTRMLFCTTGILLRRLQTDPNLTGVSHVVVDEVHERDLLSDFLLVILRSLAARRKDFHLVAMSATVNADLFKNYFESHLQTECPVVEIPGRTFPVSEYRLEDAIEATGYVCEPDGEFALGVEQSRSGRVFKMGGGGGARGAALREAVEESFEHSAMSEVLQETRDMYPEYSETTWKSLQTIDEEKINYELMELLVALIADEYEDGAILIFLPGMAEIRTLHDRLRANLKDAESRFLLIPLHSTLSSEEQKLTFNRPPPGVRKVVMATNIAETSITIDDVVFVIDSGRVRETQYDPVTRMSALVTAWCSKASSRQRRGRAGRVREGYCFHMYSSKTEATVLDDFTTPEIMRTPLDALCLQIKILGLGDIRSFLSKAIEPPPEDAIAAALKSLHELDAVDAKDELTALGHHLAELPVDARLGKMMLYGAMFSCLDPILTIAAGVGFRSPFLAPMDKRDEADAAKRKIAAESSDHLTLVRAYAGWVQARSKGRGFERDYLSKLFLSGQTLKQISEMRQQYTELLDQIGFLRSGAGALGDVKPLVGTKISSLKTKHGKRSKLELALAEASVNAGNESLVRAVICAGLYPNVATASATAPVDDSRARSRYPTSSVSVRTKHDTDVHLHPTSVCYGLSKLDARFLLYHEKVRTTKVYIRDATAVGSYPLLLFGGKIKINHERSSATCDGWIHFRAAPRVAVLFKHLRAELDALLMEKIASPSMDISHRQDVVRAIVEVLHSESAATIERGTLLETNAKQ
jgi:HrpA-like RNA helicase